MGNQSKYDTRPYHICHYCYKYTTRFDADIRTHFSRKNRCKCMSLMSYDEAKDISIKKKFIFNIDITQLTTNDLQYIVQNSHNTVNIIDETFREKIEFQLKERVEQLTIDPKETNKVDDWLTHMVDMSHQSLRDSKKVATFGASFFCKDPDVSQSSSIEKQRTCVIDIGNLLNDNHDDIWFKSPEEVEPPILLTCRSESSRDISSTTGSRVEELYPPCTSRRAELFDSCSRHERCNQSSVLAIEDYKPTKSTISTLLDSFKTEKVTTLESEQNNQKSDKLNQTYSIHTLLALLNQRKQSILYNVDDVDDVDTYGNTLKNEPPDSNLGVQVKVKEEDRVEVLEPVQLYGDFLSSRHESSDVVLSQSFSHEQEKKESTNKQCHIVESVDGNKHYQKSPIQIENEKFREKYFNKDTNRYVCNECGSSYTSKQNFLTHLSNKTRCKNMKLQQIAMKAEEENSLAKFVREEKFQQDGKIYVVQNIGCVNNIQNICNNVQNITNNSNSIANQNTMNLSLRDFISENFDISHLNKEITEKNDFFLYPNFLKAIMENESNHNIFFTEKEAIVYSDNELNRMSSDKAGFIVMDKLGKSCSELIQKQDEETQKKLDHVGNYYRVSKGQYVNDTTYREYSVEYKTFFHTASENMFRNRDKIHNKIISTLRPYNQIIRQKLMKSGYNIHDIPLFDPKIEFYSSVRSRYKE